MGGSELANYYLVASMVYLSSRIKLSAGQVFWREAGDRHRPILIFLHGSWHDSTQWQTVMEPLSKNCHCFALDLLGFGNSTAMETPNSIELEVECLHDFLNALKLRSVYLVGHSLGAWIAVSYALKYPDLVQGVVAIAPEGFSLANWRQYDRLTRYLLAHPWLFKLWLNGLKLVTSFSDDAYPLERSKAYWNYFQKFPTTCRLLFQRSTKEISRELVADRLAQFRPPFLVLQGDLDDKIAIEQSQSYARAVRKSEYKWIENTAANFSEEATIQVVLEIQGFLDRVQLKIDREEVELW
jgi:pimeloyl-ACP methyl ester carboxylesterase